MNCKRNFARHFGADLHPEHTVGANAFGFVPMLAALVKFQILNAFLEDHWKMLLCTSSLQDNDASPVLSAVHHCNSTCGNMVWCI